MMTIQEEKDQQGQKINHLHQILENIPKDPDEFYRDFGLLVHPRSGKPVEKLTSYQRRVWQEGQHYRYLLVVKSHRIGLSTSELLHDFWHAITDCRGKEILIVSQDLQHAKDHLYTLRKMILSSRKYRPYLLTKPSEVLMRDEVTKVMQMFILNPDNEFRPTRIIGLGTSVGGLWSWKDVKHIHMSDIAASQVDYTDTIHSALTRLALSGGHMVIETPPMGIGNPIYNLYLKSIEAEKEAASKHKVGQTSDAFRLIQIDATAAVDAGVMSQEYLDEQRQIMGAEFDSYFGAKFIAVGGNVFNIDALERAQELAKQAFPEQTYDQIQSMTDKSMGIDIGFGSSDTAFTILERFNGIIRVIHTSRYSRETYENMKDTALALMRQYHVQKTYVDGSASDFVRSLKIAVGELEEGQDYIQKIKDWQKDGVRDTDLMQDIIPINFSTTHKQMLAHCKLLVERTNGFAIHADRFNELTSEMYTVQEYNGAIDKTRMNFDLFDSLRLAMMYFYVDPKTQDYKPFAVRSEE